MWDMGCGMWDVGCGMWDVGCGMQLSLHTLLFNTVVSFSIVFCFLFDSELSSSFGIDRLPVGSSTLWANSRESIIGFSVSFNSFIIKKRTMNE